jgi:peroxiredoxin
MVQRLQQEIEALKAGHQSLITELRAIHATAVEEKATETAGKIEKLISTRQDAFQDRLHALELRHQRIQRAARQRTGGAQVAQQRGRPAPEFELDSFDGRTFKLSDYGDRIVVLEWFNFECPFSKYHYATKDTMVNLAGKYKDQGVVWLAVNSTNHTTPEANTEFARKHKLPFPILDDRSGRVGRAYGAKTTPHMFIIHDGRIVYEGAIDSAPLGKTSGDGGKINYVDKALSELTSGQPVSRPMTPPYGCSVKYAQR